MDRMNIIVLSMILVLLLPSQISTAQDDSTTEFTVSYHDYSPGDYFEYSGYTSSLFRALNITYSADDNYIGATANSLQDMRMSVSDSDECDIGKYTGPCHYSNLKHELNITLRWQAGSSNYLNDTLILSIQTTVEDYKSEQIQVEKKVRTIHLKSWFSTEYGEEQYLEDKLEEVLTITRSGDRPNVISVGDSWSINEIIEINTTHSTRSNRGPWDVTTANDSEDRQISFRAERYEIVDISTGIYPTIAILEQVLLSENITYVWLGEYGYPLKIEEYNNESLVFSAELLEYRYLKVNDPTASTSIHWSGICFGLFFISGLLFVVGFAAFNFRHSREQKAQTSDFDVEDLNEMLNSNRSLRTSKEQNNSDLISDRDERINSLMEKYSN